MYNNDSPKNHFSSSDNEAEILHKIFDSAPSALVMIDSNGVIQQVNDALLLIFLYSREELIGQDIEILLPDQLRQLHVSLRNKFIATPSKRIMGEGRDLFGVRKDGIEIPVEIGLNPITTDSGVYIISSIIDISERIEQLTMLKFRSAELERTGSFLKGILDNAVDGIISIDKKGNILSVNPATIAMFGYERPELIGRNVKILMPDPYKKEHDKYLENYLETGSKKIIGIGREVSGLRKDGSTFPMELSVSENQTSDSHSFTGIIRDISERKQSEDKLTKTLEDLSLSNKELEKFAYVASHDLKSPLRAIENLCHWLEEDMGEQLSGKNKEHMDRLCGRVARMGQLLDDLLLYSRAGQIAGKNETIRASDLVDETVELVNIPSDFQIIKDDSLYEHRILKSPLNQVIRNLVGNAVKHHHKTSGIVSISLEPKDSFLEFTVEDDGPGIDPKFHNRVFEMFQTLRPRDEVEGSGMGMAMVKKILYTHGGRIWLDSDVGAGTRVVFTWPINSV